MSMYRQMITAFLVVLVIALVGCSPSSADREALKALKDEVDAIKKGQAEIKSAADRAAMYSANTASPLLYELYDVNRLKAVGHLTSDVHIATGERVFLGDDIWDVKYVKVFTTPTGQSEEDVPGYRTRSVQVLVSFGGKATDPDKKK